MADEIKYSDIISPEVQAQLDQLAATVKALTAELEKLNKATAKEDATSENYNDTLRDQVEITDDLLRLTQDELVLKKQITKVQKQYDQAVEEGSINADEYGIALKKGKENLSKLGFELRNAAKLTNATKTSMTNLSLELGKNRMKYRDLTKAQRENRKEGGQLLKTIQKQDKAIKKLDAAIGNNQRNVGNYKSALSGLGSEMGSFGMAANTVTKALGFLKIGFKSVKMALMSTGIGALVVAFGSLVTYFQSTHEGAVKLEKLLAPLKITFLVLKDLAADLGEYLYNAFSDPKQLVIDLWEGIKTNLLNRLESAKTFLSAFGDVLQGVWDLDTDKIKEAGKVMGESYIDMMTGVIDTTGKAKKVMEDYNKFVSGYADEIAKKTAQEIALIERQHALEKKQLAFKTQSAKLDAEIATARLEAQQQRGKDDDTAVMAQERAMSLTKERFDLERSILAEQVSIEEQRQSMFDTTYEDQVKLADMKSSLITLDKTQDSMLRTLTEQYRTLTRAAMAADLIMDIDIDGDDSDVAKFKKTYDELEKMRRADVDSELLAWQDKNTVLEDGLAAGLILQDEYNTLRGDNDKKYFDYVEQRRMDQMAMEANAVAGAVAGLGELASAMGAWELVQRRQKQYR